MRRKTKTKTRKTKPNKKEKPPMSTQQHVITVLPPEPTPIPVAERKSRFEIFRDGVKCMEAQDYAGCHKGLLQMEEMEEQIIEFNSSIEGYPTDILVQVNRALENIYGFTHAKDRMSFFGPKPPLRFNVAIGPDKTENVVYGAMAPPAWEGGSITTVINPSNPLGLSIVGHIKRKFEPSIQRVIDTAKKLLAEQSIYRNNAVELNLNYIVKMEEDPDYQFNPIDSAPKFRDLKHQQTLVLPTDLQWEIDTHVWAIIRNPERFRSSEVQVPIRTGILLEGPPGTGKSLTAYRTAQIAVESGWTYLYLKEPLTTNTFLTGYRLAQLLGPSVYFVEDCDVLFGRDRDADMNRMLEALDGVSAKGAEVMTIFTSNFVERLNEAFMRSQRINRHITLRPLDAEAAGRFAEMIGGRFLATDVDIEAVGEAFRDLVAADITTGIEDAKVHCCGANPTETSIIGKVTTEMLTMAGEILQRKVKKAHVTENPAVARLRQIDAGVVAMLNHRS